MTIRPPNKQKKGKLPYVFIAGGALVLAVAAGLLLRAPTPVSATPSFLGLAETQYPFIVGTRIDTCNLCHVPNAIPSLNAYGTAFLNNGLTAAALVAIENMDSDGDGFTNIQELRALTFPGDPNDHPAANTATPTRTSTSVPTNTPTRVPTTVPSNTPTAVSSNTPTRAPSSTPTIVPSNTPTGVPTIVPSMTATLVPTTIGATEEPTETEEPTLTPIPSGTVVPTTTVQCNPDDERNEHIKKKHGQEEAKEQRLCKNQKDNDEGSEVNESHESGQANQSDVDDAGQQNGGEQDDNGQQGGNNNQNDNGPQGNLGSDQSFSSFIKLWLSQWDVNTRFHS